VISFFNKINESRPLYRLNHLHQKGRRQG